MRKNKNGFTLIELVAVLVIMAIIALIVTPLVMNIIKRARIAADKRSIDAYGRSIELAIAGYLMDTGTFPTQISELTIEYSGDEVVCSTTQLNSDSSVYLAECTVGGRNVDYVYGIDKNATPEPPTPTYEAYTVSATAEDTVTYNGEDYYVIEDSGSTESTVKLLKAEPLTYQEVGTYSNGTGTSTYDENGYGGMQYHSSSSDYSTSYIKQTVDAWAAAKAPDASEARLITINEVHSLGYNESCIENLYCEKTENVPSWLYDGNYWYYTMSVYNNSSSCVWLMSSSGDASNNGSVGSNNRNVVRPVIVLPKSLIAA